MDENELLFPLENEMEAVKADITNEINTANKQLADEIKKQKSIFDKKADDVSKTIKENGEQLAYIREMVKKHDEELAELQKMLNANTQMLRDMANSH